MTLSLKRKAYIVAALMMLAVVASSMSLGQSYFSAERNRVLDARRRAAENASADLESLLGRGLDRLRTVAALPALAYGMQLQERSREQRQIPAWTTLHYLFFESDVFTGGVVLVNRDGLLLWSEPSDIACRVTSPGFTGMLLGFTVGTTPRPIRSNFSYQALRKSGGCRRGI